MPNLGLSLDSHAPGSTGGKRKTNTLCLHIKKHHSNDSLLKEKFNVKIIQFLGVMNEKEGITCGMQQTRYLKRMHHLDVGTLK